MRILTLLPFLALALNINAQKLSYNTINVHYTAPAFIGLNPEVKTFSVHYHSTSLSESDIDYLFKYELEFPGMERVEEKGDLQIHFNYPNPVVISKTGSTINLLPSVLVYVKESSSNNILYHNLVNGEPVNITSSKTGFPIGSELEKINDKSVYKKDAAYEFLATTREAVNASIATFKKLYFSETGFAKLVFIGGKGSYDYSELDASFEALKEAKNLAEDGKTNEYEQVVKTQMDIWKKWLAEEDNTDKKAKVTKDIADGLKLCIASGNFILGRADIAMEMTDQLIDKSYDSKARTWALNARLSYTEAQTRSKAAANENFSLIDYYELQNQSANAAPEGASGAIKLTYKIGAANEEYKSNTTTSNNPGFYGAWSTEDDEHLIDVFFLSNYKVFTITTKKANKKAISISNQYWMPATMDGKSYLAVREFDAEFKESPTSKQLQYDKLFRVVKKDGNSTELTEEGSDNKILLTR